MLKFYTKEVNKAISVAGKNSRHVTISQGLKDEMSHWIFLQCWKGCSPWRGEKHLHVSMATDSSGYKWGALVYSQDNPRTFSDFWEKKVERSIHLKESHALINGLKAVSDVDNLACVQA